MILHLKMILHCTFILAIVFVSIDSARAIVKVTEKCGATSASVSGEWVYNNVTDKCFFISTQMAPFSEAENLCGHLKSQLAVFQPADYDFLKALLVDKYNNNSSKATSSEDKFWIGLKLSHPNRMTHRWMDGTLNNIRRAWDIGKPSRKSLEGCTLMKSSNGKWEDAECQESQPNRFICSPHSILPTAPPGIPVAEKATWGCPTECTNCVEYGEFCYSYSALGVKRSWDEADRACRRMYRHPTDVSKSSELVSIHSTYDQAFLAWHMQVDGINRWIGLHEVVDNGTLSWSDDTPFDFPNFHPGEPRGATEKECVLMYGGPLRAGLWTDDSCTHKHGYICKMGKDLLKPKLPVTTGSIKCPSGFTLIKGACLGVFPWNDAAPGSTAQQVCESNADSKLASIQNSYEQSFVVAQIGVKNKFISRRLEIQPLRNACVGGKTYNDTLTWDSGCYVKFSRTLHTMLSSSFQEKLCLSIDYEGDWLEDYCDTVQDSVVCEKRLEDCVRPPVANSAKCPTGFHDECATSDFCYMEQFDSEAGYQRIRETEPTSNAKTFSEANAHCASLNASLVTIRNQDEQICIGRMLRRSKSRVWIGLKTDEPNLQHNREACVEVRESGRWNKKKCTSDERLEFVCEIRKLP